MEKTKLQISESRINEFLDLHLRVLRRILQGRDFKEIRAECHAAFERLNYLEVATKYVPFLSFDEIGKLKAAYPLSPNKTDYQISVEGIGTGYAMCAVDARGVAYTLMPKRILKHQTRASRILLK